MSIWFTSLNGLPARKYCLYVLHRYMCSGQIAHERDKAGKLIEYMEEVRKRFHLEAIEHLVNEGLEEQEAKKILSAECDRLAEEFNAAHPITERTPTNSLPKGHYFCGCCQEAITDIGKHRQSRLHQEIEREALIIHTGTFPRDFMGVWQCRLFAERIKESMAETEREEIK